MIRVRRGTLRDDFGLPADPALCTRWGYVAWRGDDDRLWCGRTLRYRGVRVLILAWRSRG